MVNILANVGLMIVFILFFFFPQSSEVGSSVNMEREGLVRSLSFLEASGHIGHMHCLLHHSNTAVLQADPNISHPMLFRCLKKAGGSGKRACL